MPKHDREAVPPVPRQRQCGTRTAHTVLISRSNARHSFARMPVTSYAALNSRQHAVAGEFGSSPHLPASSYALRAKLRPAAGDESVFKMYFQT